MNQNKAWNLDNSWYDYIMFLSVLSELSIRILDITVARLWTYKSNKMLWLAYNIFW